MCESEPSTVVTEGYKGAWRLGDPGKVLNTEMFKASIEEPVSTRIDNDEFPMWAVITIEEGATFTAGMEGGKGMGTDGWGALSG